MELPVTFSFTIQEKDASFWAQLCAGLCEHKQGAWLEEQFQYFGSQVSVVLEELLDLCDASHENVWFEWYEQNDLTFRIVMVGGYGTEDCLPQIKKFLNACPISNLSIELEYEE